MFNFFKKSQPNVASKFETISKNELNNISGGIQGDPIPGVDVALEQNPGSVMSIGNAPKPRGK